MQPRASTVLFLREGDTVGRRCISVHRTPALPQDRLLVTQTGGSA